MKLLLKKRISKYPPNLSTNAGSRLSSCFSILYSSLHPSVDDIRDEFTNLWNDPSMSCHLTKEHERTISTLYASASPSSKRGRKLNTPPESLIQTLPAEVQSLQHSIDSVELTCFKYEQSHLY